MYFGLVNDIMRSQAVDEKMKDKPRPGLHDNAAPSIWRCIGVFPLPRRSPDRWQKRVFCVRAVPDQTDGSFTDSDSGPGEVFSKPGVVFVQTT